jgi:hypothetical protein
MKNELRIKATKNLMKSDLTAEEIVDAHETMCMTGAIEFLRKAKAICQNREKCSGCPAQDFCLCDLENGIDYEADLVRKVMDYQIKEVSE